MLKIKINVGLKFAFELGNHCMNRYSAISLMLRAENSQFDELIQNALALIWEILTCLLKWVKHPDGVNPCSLLKGRHMQECISDPVVTDPVSYALPSSNL